MAFKPHPVMPLGLVTQQYQRSAVYKVYRNAATIHRIADRQKNHLPAILIITLRVFYKAKNVKNSLAEASQVRMFSYVYNGKLNIFNCFLEIIKQNKLLEVNHYHHIPCGVHCYSARMSFWTVKFIVWAAFHQLV